VTLELLEQEIARLHGASFAWALLCCRWNESDAEEVLQAAYLRVLDGRARYAGEASIKTWLFSVVRNVAAETRRRRWLREEALARWHARPAADESQPSPEEILVSSRRAKQVQDALGQLAERQREVLDLVFFHGLTIEEAAQVMGVSLGTARTHYERGKGRLLLMLAPEEAR